MAPESRKPPNLPNPNDVSPTTSHDLRCPRCSAHTPPGADWCTLCYADLRPPAPEAPPAAAAVETVPDAEPTDAQPTDGEPTDAQPTDAQPTDAELTVGPTRPGNGKHARAATTYDDKAATAVTAGTPRDPAETAKIEAQAAEMLAMLAADIDHPLGPLAARLESTSSRAVAACVGAVLLLLVILLGMTLLGHFI